MSGLQDLGTTAETLELPTQNSLQMVQLESQVGEVVLC